MVLRQSELGTTCFSPTILKRAKEIDSNASTEDNTRSKMKTKKFTNKKVDKDEFEQLE